MRSARAPNGGSFAGVTTTPSHLATSEALAGVVEGASSADVVLLAAHALRLGNTDYALALCDAFTAEPAPALKLVRAAALFGAGQRPQAIALCDEVLASAPQHLGALFYRAQMAQHLGDDDHAAQLLLGVLERSPDFPGAQGALAALRMPGPGYRDVLRRIHELLAPRAYLEIGVESGATLALARAAERVVGVDPDASTLRPELVPAGARVFHETSDAFFASHTRREVLGDLHVALGFIDGMHWFEYALRDFINLEAWCSRESTIILHDCLPVFPLTASRQRQTKFWLGDVWKVVCILRELRPELRVKVVATAPSGLCVVRGLDPTSRVLAEALPGLLERYRDLPYPAAALQAPPGFELCLATEHGLREALR